MHGATYEPEVYLETLVQAMYNDFEIFLSPALNHLLTTYFHWNSTRCDDDFMAQQLRMIFCNCSLVIIHEFALIFA